MKFYVQRHINNPEAFKIEQRTQPDHNTVCECSPTDDLEVMDIVDNIDELTGAVIGKKLQFNEVKYEQKQIALLTIERNKKLDQLRVLRDAKLPRVDLLVNLAVLYSWTTTEKNELKTYREALLNITEPYKINPILLDSIDLNNIQWPVEPSES